MKIKKLLVGGASLALMIVASGATRVFADDKCNAKILTWISCGGEKGEGIYELLRLVLNIMSAGVVILAIVGITISGIQWLTARDKEEQIVKAKSRLSNIVIGLIVWALMWLVLNWIMPGGLEGIKDKI